MTQVINPELIEILKPFFPTRREWQGQITATGGGDITSVTAGSGLTGGGTSGAVTVDAIGGDGITANVDDLAIDLETTSGLAVTATGLAVGAGDGINVLTATIEVDLQTPSGLSLAAGGLALADSVAGSGLSIDASKVLSVDWTAGSSLAGDGLVWDGVGNEIDMQDPATLSVSTSNSTPPFTNHTHAITSSSAPGAAASLLASDASGYLQLVRLGIGVAPLQLLHVQGTSTQFRLSYDASHYVTHRIAAGGDLTVTLAGGGDVVELVSGTSQLTLSINGGQNTGKGLKIEVENVVRWLLQSTGETESGSDAGSPLKLYRYSDAGANLGTVFEVVRATGYVEFENRIGIGVAPSYPLHILSTDATQFRLAYDGSNYADLSVDATGDLDVAAIGDLTLSPTGDIYLTPTGGDVRITGDLGIGVVPTRALHIRSTAFPQVKIDYDSSNYATFAVAADGRLTLGAVGTDADILLSSAADIFLTPTGGNVQITGQLGVGVTPAASLHARSASDTLLKLDYDATYYATLDVGAAGSLTIAPVGDIVLDPTGNDILPGTAYEKNIGALTNKYLTVHAAELWVETLVAQDTIATIGGRILVGPTTILAVAINGSATTITVKHNQMTNGDIVYMEANAKVEFMIVDGSAVANGSNWDYTVARAYGSGANSWDAGDAIFNTGKSGNGFIDLYSVSGVDAGSTAGPTIVGNVRYSDTTELFTANPGFETLAGATSELILNPGFETAGGGGADVFANWIETQGDASPMLRDATAPHSGTYNLIIFTGATDNSSIASAAFTVVGGAKYNFSFWAKGSSSEAGRYRVYDATNTADIISYTSTGVTGSTWTQVSLTFVAPATCVSVQVFFKASATSGNFSNFDDVSVTEVDIWDNWAEITGDGALANETGSVHGGSNAAKITTGASADTYIESDAITVTSDSLYELSFWTRGDGTGAGDYKIWDDTNSADILAYTGTGVSGTSYAQESAYFVTPATCVAVKIFFKANSTNTRFAMFDDASLIKQVYNTWTESWAIGNMNGLYGYGSDTYGLGLGRSDKEHVTIDENDGIRFYDETGTAIIGQLDADVWTLGLATTENVNITATAIELRDGTDVYTSLTAGSLVLGAPLSAEHLVIDSANGVRFYDDHATVPVLVGQLTGTAWTIGEVDTNLSNIQITAGALNFRTDEVVNASLSAAGLLTLGLATTDHIEISSTTISFMDNATTYASMTGALWKIGLATTEHIEISSTSIDFMDNTTSYANLTGSTFRIGPVSGSPKTTISSSGVVLHDGSNDMIQLLSTGDITIGRVATDHGNIFYDADGGTGGGGRLNFRGGTSGTEVHSYLDTDGSIVAGVGAVTINDVGIQILAPDTVSGLPGIEDREKIEFMTSDGLSTLATIEAYQYTTGTNSDVYAMYLQLIETYDAGDGPYVALVDSEISGRTLFLSGGTGGDVVAQSPFIASTGVSEFSSSSGIKSLGGLYIGSTAIAPTSNWVQVLGDISLSSGLSVGDVSNAVATGDIQMTGSITLSESVGCELYDDVFSVATGTLTTLDLSACTSRYTNEVTVNTTNDRFDITIAGLYMTWIHVSSDALSADVNTHHRCHVYDDSAAASTFTGYLTYAIGSNYYSESFTRLVHLDVDDYVYWQVSHDEGTTENLAIRVGLVRIA